MVSDAQCLDWLRATRLGRRFRLDQSFVCAGGEEGYTLIFSLIGKFVKDEHYLLELFLKMVKLGKDACRGDGGGPLVCPKRDDPERFVQVVMMSSSSNQYQWYGFVTLEINIYHPYCHAYLIIIAPREMTQTDSFRWT